MSRRVVITGLGPVTSAGIGKEELFDSVWNRRLQPAPIPPGFKRGYSFRSAWYLPLPEVSLAAHGLEVPHANAMQAEDRLALVAAKLALADAGYTVVPRDGGLAVEGLEEAGLILGTGLSGMQTACESYLCHNLPREVLQSALPTHRPAFNRMVVPRTMPNSPAAWTSIAFGLTGPCYTVNASCASGTYALGEAFRRVKDGYARVLLAGGVESLQDPSGFTMRGFDVLGVLTQAPDGRPGPFGKRRSGFLFAEGGACLLVLEELDHALARRSPIYAEIADYRATSDAVNVVQIDPEGKQIVRLLGDLSAGHHIDYLNAHGTGTVANDDVEARAVQTVFGDAQNQPRINSTKGIVGHTLGASGAIEAAVTALAIARGAIHGNLTSDPMNNLNLPLDSVATPVENAVSVSYGFGGHNAGLRLRKFSSGQVSATPPTPS